jgi:hypothetical protein
MLFLFYEFLIVHLLLLLFVVVIQTCLRAVVCATFIKKILVIARKEHLVKPFYMAYFGLIGSIALGVIIFAVIPGRHINCNETIFSNLNSHPLLTLICIGYHWYVIDSLDFLQSVFIILTSYYLVGHFKRLEDVSISNLSHEKKNMDCLRL